ncbi:methyltransferase domain-containing protein [Candidatus Woesearchaeota archaeon]|nr:methyltransferase domain-containing protein [Candidatus Woesearchaeota archaeon]
MTPKERFAKFEKIRAHFKDQDNALLAKGKLAMGETSFGFWGTTNMNDAYELFKRIGLDKKKHLIDLGSGDGRIVAIASLFTKAVGIEGDETFVEKGKKAKKQLTLKNMKLKQKDYYDENLEQYDIVFMFPDKEFDDKIVEKLKKEFKGTLYIYNNLYLPKGLKKGKTIRIEQLPIASYVIDEKQ